MRGLAAVLLVGILLFGCAGNVPQEGGQGTHIFPGQPETPAPSHPSVHREGALPPDKVKVSVDTDDYPPQLHSDEWEHPVPLLYPINTLGAEDSAFIMPDGDTLYFFFTPDVRVPPERQLLDNVTGIYVSHKENGLWGMPGRVWLTEPGKLALDGCGFVQGDGMWFCSAREGNYRGVDLWVAQYSGGKWSGFRNAGEKLNVEYEVGEMHLSADWNVLYFHSGRDGGKGGLDIWYTEKINGEWQEPVNMGIMNSPENEGWPFVSQDGNEFWFTRFYMGSPAIFRSKKTNGEWGEPELIVSQFAGEPTLDNEGNLYFTHHFYENGEMLEADIYVAYRKK